MSCLCDLTEFQTVIGNIDIHGDSERGTPRMGGRVWGFGHWQCLASDKPHT